MNHHLGGITQITVTAEQSWLKRIHFHNFVKQFVRDDLYELDALRIKLGVSNVFSCVYNIENTICSSYKVCSNYD